MSRKDKRDDWDNGMTIAPMNGDELPKYRRAIYLNSERRPKTREKKRHNEKGTARNDPSDV